MLEFLFEFIFEIIIEGSLELGTDRKIPWPLRIFALLIFLGIYGGLTALFAYIGAGCWRRGDLAAAIVVWILDAFFAALIVYLIRKKFKEKRDDKDLHQNM